MCKFLFYVLMRLAEQVSNRGAEQDFIRQQGMQIGCLLQPFVATDMGAVLGAKKKRHLILRQVGALAVRANVIG